MPNTVGTLECRLTLKPIDDIIRSHSQMHHVDKYSQHSSIIWPVWLNDWLFVYELSDVDSSPTAVTFVC